METFFEFSVSSLNSNIFLKQKSNALKDNNVGVQDLWLSFFST